MKKFLSSLSGLGLVSLLVMGTSASSTHAKNNKSPLRGTWSFSEFVPATPAFHTPTPIPTASAGTLFMKEDNSFTAHTVVNTDQDFPFGPVLEFDLTGSCTFRPGASQMAWIARLRSQRFLPPSDCSVCQWKAAGRVLTNSAASERPRQECC